jgi:hypothetical protein
LTHDAIDRVLDSRRTVWAGAGLSLAIGLVFTFVWAPHPWGWRGIDQYHQLALGLARGDGFQTTDVPWAYAYYVAAFYTLAGEQPWLPVLVQVVANAFVPILLYHLAAPLAGRPAATLAALLIGLFSFTTVYASTQSSDALCTLGFLGALLLLARGWRTGHVRWYVASGLLSGVVPQFRPNMILLPLVGAVLMVRLSPARRRDAVNAIAYLAAFALALVPWTIHNYRLTGLLIPTSTHGGVQLWYGTLQVGDFLESRAHNPRSVFEAPAFDYTSLAGQSIVVSASSRGCAPGAPVAATLHYRTDRERTVQRVSGQLNGDGSFTFHVPGQPIPTTVSYWFETVWPAGPNHDAGVVATPSRGEATPLVYFVSDDHLGDMDRHGDVLDAFDIVRLVQHLAWSVPIAGGDLDANGVVDTHDVERATGVLVGAGAGRVRLTSNPERATLDLSDGSTLQVPRTFVTITDLHVSGALATALSVARVPMWTLGDGRGPDSCLSLEQVTVNEPFYRREPHMMRRYTALAWDNIRRDPPSFALASAYRALRLFVIRGTDDQSTTQQFRSSGSVYTAAMLLSLAYLAVFLAGAVLTLRWRSRARILLVPIAYIPATICFVLTNMRYTLTVQPLMFVFVAIAVLAVRDRARSAP